MKATKVGGFLLVILVVVYILAGWFIPSVEFTTEVTVERRPAVAFTVMTDLERLGAWLPGFQKVDSVMETEDRVGSRYIVQRVDESGSMRDVNIEITAWNPNQVYGYRRWTDRSTTEAMVTFVAASDGTTITADTRVTGNTWYVRSWLALTRSSTISNTESTYSRLASVVAGAAPVLPGQWHGTDTKRAEHLFTFHHDGTAEWKVTGNQGVTGVSDIVWSIDHDAEPMHLDLSGFSSGPLEGKVLYGIVEFESESQIRFDAEMGAVGDSSVRPEDFTDSAVTYYRVN